MIRLRHILHPLRSGRSLYQQIDESVRRHIAKRSFQRIRRGYRNRCWCGGELLAFKWHTSYGVCAECGSYVNLRPPVAEELARLYSFGAYWHAKQRLRGYPTIEKRAANDRSDGRVDYWLKLIQRFGPPGGRVLEVGCAHGVLLVELYARGFDCVGLEPDQQTADWTRRATGLDIRSGFFPCAGLPHCSLFIAFDVMEHSPDPAAFLNGAAELLDSGGIAIIQTPINRYDYEPPFGERFEDAFDDIEHLHLFTDTAMRQLASRSRLEIVDMTERLWLHHEICVFRKA